MFPITLKAEKIHGLVNALSRAPYAPEDENANFNEIEVPFIQFEDFIGECDKDQLFGQIVKAFSNNRPDNLKEMFRLKQLL